jgi:F0F1-type ATP synthase epsilon subunit
MLFLLTTPEYNNLQLNTTKVRVHLRSGVAEVFDQHQDLMGKVDNNIIEIETNFENKLEKTLFVLQDGVFIVSNKGLDVNSQNKGTSVYVYAKRVREIVPNVSLEEISKQYEQKTLEFENENQKLALNPNDKVITSKLFLLTEELEFLKKALSVVKEVK